MKRKVSITMIFLCTFLSIVADISVAEYANYKLNLIKRFYSIGTATINGTYYPVGTSIARILTQNLTNCVFIAEPTEGSVANVEYLRKNQIDLALMQSDIAWQAAKGVGPFIDNSFKELRVLSSLYSEVVQIVVRSNSSIKTIADLKGCKISVGSKESGSAVNAAQVLAAAGLQPGNYELVHERFTKATESLRDGYVDAIYYTGAIPADGISRLAAKIELRLIDIPPEVQQQLVKEYPYFSTETIPAGSYRGQITPCNTIGLRALLVTTEHLSDKDAYDFLKIIFQNSLLISAQHNKHNTSLQFKRSDYLKGVEPEMLHPGAIKFFAADNNN